MRYIMLFYILLILLFPIIIFSQIPHTLSYQGVLKNGSGAIMPNGSYLLTFKLYDTYSGDSSLWSETKSITVQEGVFTTQLGSTAALTLPFTEGYWLGVTVGEGSELTPRFPLSSVPYSFMSMNVLSGSITAEKIPDGQVVKSLNGLKDSVNLVAGSNVTITPSGNNLTISSITGGSGGVSGSGGVNYLPLFTGTTAIGNSTIYQNSGNIGIGTTVPSEKLSISADYGYGISHEANSIKLSTYIDDGGAYLGTISNNPLHFYTNNGAAQMSLITNGNIGIGNTNPAAKFEIRHISDPSSPSLLLFDNNSNNYSRLRLQNSSGSNYWEIAGFLDNIHANSRLNLFHSNAGNVITLSGDGNVGIGAIAPNHRLHVKANSFHDGLTQILLEESEEDYARLRFQNTVASRFWEIGSLPKSNNTDAAMNFYYNNSGVVLSLKGDGNVGVGTTTPGSKLEVIGNVRADNFQYNTHKTSYYAIPPSDFKASIGLYEDEVVREGIPPGVWMAAGVIGLVAGIHLPHGATITNCTVYYSDNSSSYDIDVMVQRRFNGAESPETIGSFTSAGTPGNTMASISSFSNPVVSNLFYNYYIHVNTNPSGFPWPGSALVIKSIIITYTTTQAE